MKKLPEITLQDWLDAEQSVRKQDQPKPSGVTAPEYGKMRNLCRSSAARILFDLYNAGKATRVPWLSGGHIQWVYTLKK